MQEVLLPETIEGGAFALFLPGVYLATPHSTADGTQAFKPQGGLTSCTQLTSWGDGETSALSFPHLLERIRLALLNPQAKGAQSLA